MNNYIKCKWSDKPIKRQRLAEWTPSPQKEPTICYLQETHLKVNDISGFKAKKMGKR